MVSTRVVVDNVGCLKEVGLMDARLLEVLGLTHGKARVQWVLAPSHGRSRLPWLLAQQHGGARI